MLNFTAKKTALGILIGGLLIASYQNCSKAQFAGETAVTEMALSIGASAGGIVINNNDPFTNQTDVQLMLMSAGADQVYVTNQSGCAGGGQWEPYVASKAWKLPLKNQAVAVFAKFRESGAPAAESACVSDQILHDDISPTVLISKGVSPYIKVQNASAQFEAKDSGSGIASIKCKLDAINTFEDCTSSYNKNSLAEGGHVFKAVAYDKAGNASAPVEVSFAVDLTAPVITLNQTPPKISSTATSSFLFSATDALSGVAGYECQLPGQSSFASCSSPKNLSSTLTAQKFLVRATDRAGNISAVKSYDWTFDASAPAVRILTGPALQTNQNSASFTFSSAVAGDIVSRFECAVDAGSFSACSSPKLYSGLAAGEHTFQVRGYDQANNVSAPAVYQWSIDMSAPIVKITSVMPRVTKDISGSVSFTVTDVGHGVKSTECQLNSGSFQACTSPFNYSGLVNGKQTVTVRATDFAGNTGTAVATWNVDLVKPSVRITASPANPIGTGKADFEFIATDAGQITAPITECRMNSEAQFSACVSPRSYVNLLDGISSFYVRAIDEAGNISDVVSYSWLIDSLAPAINIGLAPETSIGNLKDVQIQFSVTDAGSGVDKVTCGLQNNPVDCKASELLSLGRFPTGTYNFVITAKDKIGNSSSQTITWNVVDQTVPMNQQVTAQESENLDVLVVIDNSGSMAPEQANMSNRIQSFLDQLQGIQWRVGIITTDVSDNANLKDGRLIPINGLSNSYWIDSTMSLAKTYFSNTIQRPESGSGNEQGIRSTYRAIQRINAFDSISLRNKNFFRSDAALAVIVITDADETNSSGTFISNTPSGLLNLVQTTWKGKKAFAFHSIIVKPGDSVCKSDAQNEDYGYAYDALSKLTGGVVGTVCSLDYGAQLTEIGVAARNLVRSTTLQCAPLDMNGDGRAEISMTANSGATMTLPNWTLNGLTLSFDQALVPGDYTLSYRCLK